MRYHVTLGSRTLEVDLGPEGVSVDGRPLRADLAEVDGTDVRTLLLSGKSHRVLATRKGKGDWSLHLGGRHLDVQVLDERTHAIREMTGEVGVQARAASLTAPMPGLVVKVEVEEGDEVFPGQGVVIVEAMKMENELKAEGHARVARVVAVPGTPVEMGEVLVEFEPTEEEE